MNGVTHLAGGPACDPAIIALLEGALAMARRGELVGCAVVLAHGPNRFNVGLAGGGGLDLHYGLGKLQRLIEGQLDGGKQSSIVRAVGDVR